MERNETSRRKKRRKRRATNVWVALLALASCVFDGSDVVSQVVENAEVKVNVAPEEKERERLAKERARRFREQTAESFLETRAVFYPTELAWGDAAYFATVERNLDAEPRNIYAPNSYEVGKRRDFGKIAITSPDVAGEYVYRNELAFDYLSEARDAAWMDSALLRRHVEIAPGEERFRVRAALEFPPLEDANAPFWAAIRQKLDAEGSVVLRLSVDFERTDESVEFRNDVFETEVVVNKRISKEAEKLDRWFDATPKEMLPIRREWDGGGYKAPQNKKDGERAKSKENKKSFISLNGDVYEPWAFLRVGNRKPAAPNNPTDLEGWRKLESEFAPSTLRDEITFVRLQLEYYAASPGFPTGDALKALIAWLAARPEAQRAVLAASVEGKSNYFKGKELAPKYRALAEAVERSAARWAPNRERFAAEEGSARSASRIYEPLPPLPEPFETETRHVVWPREAFFGDVAYFAAIERNVSPTLGGARNVVDFEFLKRHYAGPVEIEAEGIDIKHRYFQELWPLNVVEPQRDAPSTLLPPGEERAFAKFAFELPPLEDWNDPFWAAVREKLATEKRVALRCRFKCWNGGRKKPTPLETVIVLKERPSKELEKVAGWFDATPDEFFPKRVGQHTTKTLPSLYEAPRIVKSGAEGIELDASGELFCPWLFLRVGNRKPSDPNNPTTVDGWRKLEREFEASTLRDEITFARLQLEYYAASTNEEAEVASKALVAWLAARPEAQRVVLSASVFSKAPEFAKTRLNAKYVALVEAIWSEAEIARLLEKRDCVAEPTEEKTGK